MLYLKRFHNIISILYVSKSFQELKSQIILDLFLYFKSLFRREKNGFFKVKNEFKITIGLFRKSYTNAQFFKNTF